MSFQHSISIQLECYEDSINAENLAVFLQDLQRSYKYYKTRISKDKNLPEQLVINKISEDSLQIQFQEDKCLGQQLDVFASASRAPAGAVSSFLTELFKTLRYIANSGSSVLLGAAEKSEPNIINAYNLSKGLFEKYSFKKIFYNGISINDIAQNNISSKVGKITASLEARKELTNQTIIFDTISYSGNKYWAFLESTKGQPVATTFNSSIKKDFNFGNMSAANNCYKVDVIATYKSKKCTKLLITKLHKAL